MDNKKLIEVLQMQPLSEEEKASRHILGRLYGPIATTKESTRNGRKYNAELWTKALNDEVFKEKIANKSLFLELGHPTDREETDMTKVCACIPEMPKVVDGDLYAYVDILDTQNGRLLKTLCDYGFIPGISSRGSGDIMSNDEVDPETFYLECWDVVQLPAVKKARLAMCESYSGKTLKQALTESFNAASEEEKENMKEALDNLDIKLEEAETVNIDDIPWASSEDENLLVEESNDEDIEILNDKEDDEERAEIEVPEEVKAETSNDDEPIEIGEPEVAAEEIPETAEEESEENEDVEAYTIASLQKELEEFDSDSTIEFSPLEIEGVEYPIEMLGFESSEDGKVLINIGYSQEIGNNIDDVESEEILSDDEEISEPEITEPEEVSDTEEDDEVIESLKEMVRQKDELEGEVKSLRAEKAVSDTKVKELEEKLNSYTTAFDHLDEMTDRTASLESEICSLKEQLENKNTQIVKLKRAHISSLNEGLEKSNAEINSLKENLLAKEQEHKEIENELSEQVNTYKSKLNESIKVANSYKAKCSTILEAYISFRAQMLGVKPAEITNKLNEKYTIKDIDDICDRILTESVSNSQLPFSFNGGSKVRINESKDVKKNPNDDYDFDSLYELAGLK